MSPSRAQWRDAIKDSTLTPAQRFVALTMADYWKPNHTGPIWCAVSTICHDTGYSQASVYRALSELREQGWLDQVAAFTPTRSPRYQPSIPQGYSHSERTPEGAGSSQSERRVIAQREKVLSGCDLKPHVNHSPPHRPSQEEKEEEVEGKGSWTGYVWQCCPSCGSVDPCSCNLIG